MFFVLLMIILVNFFKRIYVNVNKDLFIGLFIIVYL